MTGDHDLLAFSTGDRIEPQFLEDLQGFFRFYESVLGEDHYAELMDKGADACFRFLAEALQMLLRDRDWERIWETLQHNPDSFQRYYPAARVEITSNVVANIVRAIMTNDDFYALLCSGQGV